MSANCSPWLPRLASLRLWAQAAPDARSRTGLAAATAFAVLGRTTHAGPARRAAVHVTALKWPAAQNECCQQWMALSGTRWNGCTTASGGLSAHRLNPKLGASHHFTGRTPTLSSVLLRQHEVVSVSKQRRPQAVSEAPTPHTYDRRRIRRQVEARIVRPPQLGAHR